MSGKKQRLELTWVGKDEAPKLEPRILIGDPTKSYGDKSENMLIKGDNLLALKALEQEYAGKVKCVYIDPPYNTGQAFQNYDDQLEHSIWLSLIKERLNLLHRLLCEDGVLFCQLNDDEMSYAKVLFDEVFGRQNFLNHVCVKMKQTAGASGGGEDKKLKKNIEHILIYTKDTTCFKKFNEFFEEEDLFELIAEMEESGKSWKYTSVLTSIGEFIEERTILDGSGEPILCKKYKGIQRTTVSALSKNSEGIQDAYLNNFEYIFSDTNAQTSIRARIIEEFVELDRDELIIVQYMPKSGKEKGMLATHYYISPTIRRIIWLKDSAYKKNNSIVKKEKLGTYWEGFPLNNLTKEGGVQFPNGKKPETLIARILDLSTNDGDLVLDSFLGSGTTAAVAHKMGRRWIGIEMGEHCDTHCLPRLKAVVDGSDMGGISKSVGWSGGGGFAYYSLAPSLIRIDEFGQAVIDERYNADMLAAAMARHEGFVYSPDAKLYWKQGIANDTDYIYTTTGHITPSMLDTLAEGLKENESLVVCAKSFDDGCKGRSKKITLKKIPQAVMDKCEYKPDGYPLNIVNPPIFDDEEEE